MQKNAPSLYRLISYRILIAICFLSVFLVVPKYIYAACNCATPSPCPVQPTAPCTAMTSANSYILRYSINGDHGSMTFIGNTLGLSKTPCQNNPGSGAPGTVVGSIGAFTTTDPTQTVGSYATIAAGTGSPSGTTLDWTKNASSAVLSLPAGVTILHAELIWSGSFGYFCADPVAGVGVGVDPNCVLSFANGPINFTTPDGVTHLVLADPTTALESLNPSPEVANYYCAGNYTRSQDVTALIAFLSGLNGTYTVGGVPATVSALDDTHNACGWTLAVVYHDPSNPVINNMSLFLGAQQGSRASVVVPASVSGFCAQTSVPSGFPAARILVSAVEGDADIAGDQMLFGPTSTSLSALSGPNNLVNNFFASQINNDAGALINTTGTFCTYNQDPATLTLIPNGRQGYDITNVDASSFISSGQTQAFALGTTTGVGDDYMINALGIQISVASPVIFPIKLVNGQNTINASLGDTVGFTVTMNNSGTIAADNVVFQDTLESGLEFISGSVTVNDIPMAGASPSGGISLGTIDINATKVMRFQVKIVSPPPVGGTFFNSGNATFGYSACTSLISTNNKSNLVSINLASETLPAPGGFYGAIHQCQFINKKAKYSMRMTWEPAPLSSVIAYKIFKAGVLVATIPATSPYVYDTFLNSKSEAYTFTLVAVYPNNFQSLPINIRITNG